MLRALNRLAKCRSGAAAVEFAIVCMPLLLVSLGVVEFGRALFIRNDLAYAADVAARKVLIGQIPAGASASEAAIGFENAIRDAFDGDVDQLQIAVGVETVDGVPYRTLSIRYPFTFLVPGVSDSPLALSVSRRIPVS
ncbi:TadE/TadG family type IV pilus assembly protein [Nitratireductor sp. ZSWI3]|uniref:TadE/TadG family type IV pilus assembly protein n=1 Tax=Nitratireductor sp. ZSWI3 TaxID=2966359 RepID=UPI0021505E6C|nr:TadE/TadG family type IV pilus assembly protein [Nitratireductor sp. ZSWI3]MCR4264732.1 pilus assembly protein [Nitratireductor sp. ZSWI3]